MTTTPSWARTLETIGRAGRAAGWWREALDAAQAEEAHSIVMRTDQVRWIVGKLDTAESAGPEGSGWSSPGS